VRASGGNILFRLLGVVGLVRLDPELAELKRAVVHLEMGVKAYKTATLAQTDADRLLAACGDELARIASVAQEAVNKIKQELGTV